MPDPRVTKLARILVEYSMELKPGQQVLLRTTPLAQELNLAFYELATKAGAYVWIQQAIPGAEEAFLKYASDQLLNFIPPATKLINESFDANLYIEAEQNTQALAGVDPRRIAQFRKSRGGLFSEMLRRGAEGKYRVCITAYPTPAQAQEAGMSLADYTEFVYGAGMLNLDDPLEYWRAESRKQSVLIDWLKGHDQVVLKGKDIDLSLSIKGRTYMQAAGKENFPDGEIYTSPVEDSASGWVRFRYPAIYDNQEVTDIELWFEKGKVIREKAAKNQEFLTSMLNTDAGSRFLGEWGIGTNYGIQRFTKSMLFDEKIGGTIHLALGAGFPECGGGNESGLHWDMLCDMSESEVKVDGELFYKNGRAAVQ